MAWTKIEEIKKQMREQKAQANAIEDPNRKEEALRQAFDAVKQYAEDYQEPFGLNSDMQLTTTLINSVSWKHYNKTFFLCNLLKALLLDATDDPQALEKANQFLDFLKDRVDTSKVPTQENYTLKEACELLHRLFPNPITEQLNNAGKQREGVQWNRLREALKKVPEKADNFTYYRCALRSRQEMIDHVGSQLGRMASGDDAFLIHNAKNWRHMIHDLLTIGLDGYRVPDEQREFLQSLRKALEELQKSKNMQQQTDAIRTVRGILKQEKVNETTDFLSGLLKRLENQPEEAQVKDQIQWLDGMLDENNKNSPMMQYLSTLQHWENCLDFCSNLRSWQHDNLWNGAGYEREKYDAKHRRPQDEKCKAKHAKYGQKSGPLTQEQKKQLKAVTELDELLNQLVTGRFTRVISPVIKDDVFGLLKQENLQTLLAVCLMGKHQLRSHMEESKEAPDALLKSLEAIKGKPLTQWLKALPNIFYTNENLADLDNFQAKATAALQEAQSVLAKVTRRVFMDFLWDLNYCLAGSDEDYGKDNKYFDTRLLPKMAECCRVCSKQLNEMKGFIPACVNKVKEDERQQQEALRRQQEEIQKKAYQCWAQAGLNVEKLREKYVDKNMPTGTGQTGADVFEPFYHALVAHVKYYADIMYRKIASGEKISEVVPGSHDAIYVGTSTGGKDVLTNGMRVGKFILNYDEQNQPYFALALKKEAFPEVQNLLVSDPTSKHIVINVAPVTLKETEQDGKSVKEVFVTNNLGQSVSFGTVVENNDTEYPFLSAIKLAAYSNMNIDPVAQIATQPHVLGFLTPPHLAINTQMNATVKYALTELHAKKRKDKFEEWCKQNPNATPQQKILTKEQIYKDIACTWAEELRYLADYGLKPFLNEAMKNSVAYQFYRNLHALADQAEKGNQILQSITENGKKPVSLQELPLKWSNDPLIQQFWQSSNQLYQSMMGNNVQATAQVAPPQNTAVNGFIPECYVPQPPVSQPPVSQPPVPQYPVPVSVPPFQMTKPDDMRKIGLNPGLFFVNGEASAVARIKNFCTSFENCHRIFHNSGTFIKKGNYIAVQTYRNAISMAIGPMLNVQGAGDNPFVRYIDSAQRVIQDLNSLNNPKIWQEKQQTINAIQQLKRNIPRQQLEQQWWSQQQLEQLQQRLRQLPTRQKFEKDYQKYQEQYAKCQNLLQTCVKYAAAWDQHMRTQQQQAQLQYQNQQRLINYPMLYGRTPGVGVPLQYAAVNVPASQQGYMPAQYLPGTIKASPYPVVSTPRYCVHKRY